MFSSEFQTAGLYATCQYNVSFSHCVEFPVGVEVLFFVSVTLVSIALVCQFLLCTVFSIAFVTHKSLFQSLYR